MTIGRKRSRAACSAASIGAHALEQALLRELDDQDRVLRREADQHHQADLEVDVVLHAAQPDEAAARRATANGTASTTANGSRQRS